MNVLKIAANGAKLLRKDLGTAVKKGKFKDFVIPKEAETFDSIRVKKGALTTDIFTFRDKNGEMLTRVFRKNDGKNVTQTVRKYTELFPDEMTVSETDDITKDILARKITSFTRTNGKISEIGEEVISHTDEAVPIMTHSKRVIRPKYEAVSIEQRQKGTAPKFIRNEYETDMYAVGEHSLIKSEVSSPELKEIAEHPYFLSYTSPNTKFARRISNAVKDEANLFFLDPQIKIYKKPGKGCGFYRSTGTMADDTVNINISTEQGLIDDRSRIVATAGHEFEHVKWDEKCTGYQTDVIFDSIGENPTYTIDEIPLIKKYIYGSEHYTPPSVDTKKYYENFTEVTARKGEKAAYKKYTDLADAINTEFPAKHGFQFYNPHYELQNDRSFFYALMNYMR